MHVTWLYGGDDGESHFADLEIPSTTQPTGTLVTDWLTVEGLQFWQPVQASTYDFHCAPRRQLILRLQGHIEIEVAGGTRRTFGPGSVLLADDTEGHGHISRTLGAGSMAWVSVPKSLHVTQWMTTPADAK